MRNPIKKHRIFLFSLVLILSLLMAACGSAENEDVQDVVPPDQGAVATDAIETPLAESETGAADEAVVGEDEAQTQVEPAEEPAVEDTESDMADEAVGAEEEAQADVTEESASETVDPNAAEEEIAQQDQPQEGEIIPPTGTINTNHLSNLMDFEIWNRNNEQIGDVDTMIIDMHSSQIEYIVVGVGGFLGIGEKSVAIPWDAFDVNTAQPDTQMDSQDTEMEASEMPLNAFILDADEERLEQAPEANLESFDDQDEVLEDEAVEDNEDDGLSFEAQESEIQSFWGSSPMSDEMSETTGETMESTSELTGTAETETQMTTPTDRQLVLADDLAEASIVSTSGQMNTDEQEGMLEEQSTVEEEASDQQPAVDEPQADVNAVEDVDEIEELAEVEEIVVDYTTGQVTYALVSVDDDLMVDDHQTTETDAVTETEAQVGEEQLVPVPLNALNWNAQEEALTLDNSHSLQDAPTISFTEFQNDLEMTWESTVNEFWGETEIESENN